MKEPVITAQALSGLVSAGLVMLVALGLVRLDETQQAAVLAFSIAFINALFGIWARSKVTPLAEPRDRAGFRLVRQERAE